MNSNFMDDENSDLDLDLPSNLVNSGIQGINDGMTFSSNVYEENTNSYFMNSGSHPFSHGDDIASPQSPPMSPQSIASRSSNSMGSRSPRSVSPSDCEPDSQDRRSLASNGSYAPDGSIGSGYGHEDSRSRSRSLSQSSRKSGSHESHSSRSRSVSRARSNSRDSNASSRRSRSGSRSLPGSRSASPSSSEGSRSRSRSRSLSRSRSGSPVAKSRKRIRVGSDSDRSDKESDSGKAIAEIFGSSDEEGEFEGFGEDEVKNSEKENESSKVVPDISDESGDEMKKDDGSGSFVSDFDMMMERRKQENARNRRRRRKHGVEILNSNDDKISELIRRMKEAADEDRNSNLSKQPAIRKISMLPVVEAQLQRSDLHLALLDMNILGAITEWLSPLPDKSLPNLKIRETLLKLLAEFQMISAELLKMSGVGKAVMYLLKHPKETKDNKKIAQRLIQEWARPIFNLNSNYSAMSKEERLERDYSQLPKRKKQVSGGPNDSDKTAKPGEPGWVSRARVPQPSTKDYIVRPKWNVTDKPKVSKKKLSRYDKHKRDMEEKKKQRKAQLGHAVTMSIEGRNLAL